MEPKTGWPKLVDDSLRQLVPSLAKLGWEVKIDSETTGIAVAVLKPGKEKPRFKLIHSEGPTGHRYSLQRSGEKDLPFSSFDEARHMFAELTKLHAPIQPKPESTRTSKIAALRIAARKPTTAQPPTTDVKFVEEFVLTLGDLAQSKLMARMIYQKPGFAPDVTPRLVEPYQLFFNGPNLIVLTWQVEPAVEGDAWRHFRVDRIIAIENSSRQFEPRTTITLGTGAVRQFVMGEEPAKPVKENMQDHYARYLEDVLMDGDLSQDELTRVVRVSSLLTRPQIKAVHAQVYASLLNELARDGDISEDEEAVLSNMRIFLEQIGWCP